MLLSNNKRTDDAIQGSISMLGRSKAYDDDCSTLCNVAVIYPYKQHSRAMIAVKARDRVCVNVDCVPTRW